MRRLISYLAVLIAVVVPASAIDLLTWNVEQGSTESTARRLHQIGRLGNEVRTKSTTGRLPEVAVFEEITSYAAAANVAHALGYTLGSLAVSDSGSDRDIWPFALEVAIATTRKVVSVTSYQSKVDHDRPPFIVDLATGDLTFGSVQPLSIPTEVGTASTEFVPRAMLRVELEGGMVIYGVHLNSSGLGFCRLDDFRKGVAELQAKAAALDLPDEVGRIEAAKSAILAKMPSARSPGIEETRQETLRRARSREAAAGAIAKLAAVDVAADKAVLVAGDFNTPFFEKCKTGHKIDEDFAPLVGCDTRQMPTTCGATDGFDDTFAILTDGIIDGVEFKVLTKDLGHTYVGGAFADSPIDNVLIAGKGSDRNFQVLKLGAEEQGGVYGSDHHPVLVQPSP